ncbi:MAG: hypothetical protein Q8914_03455 [Bacteroidota bacterium]|nr:hypothetical protein [Bacteroidota bacterium]
MKIFEVTPNEYDAIFTGATCFNKATFNLLNASKCDEVCYLVFKDKKVRLGLVAGRQGTALSSPFSAPFGGFTVLDSKLQIPYIEEAVDLLETFSKDRQLTSINIMLPPLFYDVSFLTKVTHVLYQKNWRLDQVDLNYYYNLSAMDKEETKPQMAYNAKKNLHAALKHPFTFQVGHTAGQLETAYEIIRQNRAIKGFPLRMTCRQMLDTSNVVPIDSFLVKLEDKPVGSAIVYQVTPQIPQVVYWGDIPEYAAFRTMNYLTSKLFDYYYQNGFRLIDVGTAMHDNLPNYGLCEFKESLGCDILPRNCFVKVIN